MKKVIWTIITISFIQFPRISPFVFNREKAIQDVDEFFFFFSSEQICINSALHHLLTNGSSSVNGWVPSEWKSKQLIKASQ